MIDKNGYELQVGDYVKTTNNWTYGNGNVDMGVILEIQEEERKGPFFVLYPGKTKGSFVMAFRSLASIEKIEDIDPKIEARIDSGRRQFEIMQRDALKA